MEKIVHKTISLKKLMFHIMLPIIGSLLIRFILSDTRASYDSLALPFFATPVWLFRPLFTLTFVFLGISAYLVADSLKDFTVKQVALRLYYATLTLALLWPLVFFSLGFLNISLGLSLLLLVCLGATFVKFKAFSLPCTVCFSVFAVWTVYLALLNVAVVAMN